MVINKKMQRMELNKFILVSNKYNSEENFHKIDQIKAILNELKDSLGMEAIDKIMKTHKHYKFGVRFLEFLDLHRKLDAKKINKELSLSLRIIENWYRRYPPRPIRALLNIYFNNYHKISKRDLAYLFGWGFGDGGIDSNLSYYFICGKKEDLLKIKEYLEINIIKIPIVIEKNDSCSIIKLHNGNTRIISGVNTWILNIRDSSLCKLLYSLGLPKGNKVLQNIEIPHWIKNGDAEIKIAFLNALFEGELQKHKVRYNFKRNKIEICPITFGMNKVEEHKENLIKFFNEIRGLLNEFNIKTTDVENFKPGVIRKDGKKTYSTRFYISVSAINTINFSKIIDYKFNEDKKEALIIAVNEAINKLERMNKQVEKYKKALESYNNGKSIYKIAKELNITYSTAKHWLKTKKFLPILLDQSLGDIFVKT